jgi:preprotein translocase subunit SecG
MTVLFYLLALLFGFVCVFMILLILIQKGRGGGLSSAFGGAGGNTAFGTKTGDLLTWVTAIVFGIFLVLSWGMIWTTNALHAKSTQAVAPVVTDEQTSALDSDKDGQVEPIAPTDPRSSLPEPPATPEPGAKPSDDGVPEPGRSPD